MSAVICGAYYNAYERGQVNEQSVFGIFEKLSGTTNRDRARSDTEKCVTFVNLFDYPIE